VGDAGLVQMRQKMQLAHRVPSGMSYGQYVKWP